MKYITTLLSCILILYATKAIGQTDNFAAKLNDLLGRHLYYDDYFEIKDSNTYYLAYIKVEIDKKSKVTAIQFSDIVPDSINKDVKKVWKKYQDKFQQLDTLAKQANLKSCTLLFPATFNPSDYLIPNINRRVVENSLTMKFGGKFIAGNIITGRTITLGWGIRGRFRSLN